MWGLCGLMEAKKAQTVQRLCVGSVGCWLALTCLCDDMLVVYCGRVSKIYNLQVQYVLFWAKQGQAGPSRAAPGRAGPGSEGCEKAGRPAALYGLDM